MQKPRGQSGKPLTSSRFGGAKLLTQERINRVITAIQVAGVNQDQAAEYAGISRRTFYRWKDLAYKVGAIMPADWESHKADELRGWIDELGIEEDVVPTGARGRALKKDLVLAIQQRAGILRDLFERFEAAGREGMLANAQTLQTLAAGGRYVVDPETGKRRWDPVVTKKVIKELNKAGELVVIREEIVEAGVSETAVKFILERRYPEHWGSKKAVDVTAKIRNPEAMAKAMHEAFQSMRESVPSEPEPASA